MQDARSPYEALMLKAAQDDGFRQALLSDPKKALESHLGTALPADVTINVVENTPNELTLVLPPLVTDELSEAELDHVSGGFGFFEIAFSASTLGLGCAISAVQDSVGNCAKRSVDAMASQPIP